MTPLGPRTALLLILAAALAAPGPSWAGAAPARARPTVVTSPALTTMTGFTLQASAASFASLGATSLANRRPVLALAANAGLGAFSAELRRAAVYAPSQAAAQAADAVRAAADAAVAEHRLQASALSPDAQRQRLALLHAFRDDLTPVQRAAVEALRAEVAARAPRVAARMDAMAAALVDGLRSGQLLPEGADGAIAGRLAGRRKSGLAPSRPRALEKTPDNVPLPQARRGVLEAERVARDPSAGYAARLEAVSDLAAAAVAPEARSAVEESLYAIGRVDPVGDREDYEVKRRALRALKALGYRRDGRVVALPPVSAEVKRALIEDLRRRRVVSDRDDTLAGNHDGYLPGVVEAVMTLASPERPLMILTGRPDDDSQGYPGIITDVSRGFDAQQRRRLILGSDRGAKIYVYDAAGRPVLVSRAPGWTAAERRMLESAARDAGATGVYNGSYGFTIPLPGDKNDPAARARGEREREALARLLAPWGFTATLSSHGGLSLFVSKYEKSRGVEWFTDVQQVELALALARLSPVFHAPARVALALALSLRPSVRRLPLDRLATLGDHYEEGGIDTPMAYGVPGAIGIDVGRGPDGEPTTDPDQDGVFTWDVVGPDGTAEILRFVNGADA